MTHRLAERRASGDALAQRARRERGDATWRSCARNTGGRAIHARYVRHIVSRFCALAATSYSESTMSTPKDPSEYGPRPGLLVPQPAAERGVAVVTSASPDGKYFVYCNGTNVIVRSVQVSGC
jgi:hypothetical protein